MPHLEDSQVHNQDLLTVFLKITKILRKLIFKISFNDFFIATKL